MKTICRHPVVGGGEVECNHVGIPSACSLFDVASVCVHVSDERDARIAELEAECERLRAWNEKRRLDYAHFGMCEHSPFVAWKYEGDTSESRRTFDTMQEAQDAYNELARHAETFGIMPTHEPVSVHLVESINAKDARIASLESEILALNATLQGTADAQAELESQLLTMMNTRDEGETRERMLAADVALKDARIAALEAQLEAALSKMVVERETRCESDVCQHVAALAAARAENEGHRKAQAAIYLALGTGNPDRDSWPDAISALRAQLAAAEERARKAETSEVELSKLYDNSVAQWLDLQSKFATARIDAVREFAEQLDRWGHCRELSPMSMKHIKPTDDVARYLSSRGVPSARPDDADRLDRVAEELRRIDHSVRMGGIYTPDSIARAVLAAADGAERGGR